MKVEICHVCKKEKKPYTLFMNNNALSLIMYQQAREDGPICERCNSYYAMTHEFKDATPTEFENAEKAVQFAQNMLKWWEKDNPLDKDATGYEEHYQSRDWEGTGEIARWYRKELNKKQTRIHREYRIELDATPPSLNDLINKAKKHWNSYATLKKKWTARVSGAVERGVTPFTKPVTIDVEIYFKDKRRRDLDNYVPKLLFDGLTKTANPYDYLLEDDSTKYITAYTVRIINGAAEEKTVITIRD